MLPAPLRMRRSDDFALTIRRGARAGRPTLVVHCRLVGDRTDPHVGFVVSKAVGGAVVRNVVRRRLRGVVVEQRGSLPSGADLVVRALPPAAGVPYETLASEFRSALAAASRRAAATTGRT
ncbi:ribonuclease P protein component [Actinotalea ferrariae]|uniref:ribonuclease P protein component n=1 Tax=Actinotalea ferrariae TaxID=1386098 RepID=UPI001C8CA1FC|nr:ribonuclease P protein component [Actinotalea ferrariae]MBX9245407.1 ribonuclease P protein component [Actinotalea ferrariae]